MSVLTKEEIKNIHSCPKADTWARYYVQHFPDADLDTIRGWFANAMMAMYDNLHQTKIEAKDIEIAELKKQAREFAEYLVKENIWNRPDVEDGVECDKCDSTIARGNEKVKHEPECVTGKAQQFLNETKEKQ